MTVVVVHLFLFRKAMCGVLWHTERKGFAGHPVSQWGVLVCRGWVMYNIIVVLCWNVQNTKVLIFIQTKSYLCYAQTFKSACRHSITTLCVVINTTLNWRRPSVLFQKTVQKFLTDKLQIIAIRLPVMVAQITVSVKYGQVVFGILALIYTKILTVCVLVKQNDTSSLCLKITIYHCIVTINAQ